VFDQLVDLISGAWWSYLLIFAVSYGDVLFPLLPSETIVITAGVLAGSGDMQLGLIIPLAALGAFLGDNTAYFIGHHYEDGIRRVLFRGEKAKERLRWAERQIEERGGELIIVGRFIPGGRTAVAVSCGWLDMRWRRFVVFDAIAAVIWASYAALLGYFGGKAFEEQPWKGLLLAFAIALGVAGGVELVRWLLRRRKAERAVPGRNPEPEAE
jgi:membrane protein DedA with SNARE-associated domain